MRLERGVLLVGLIALLGACAGGAARPKQSESKRAAELQVELAQGYMAQNELETASEKLERALQLDPDSVDAHTLVAVLNERIGRSEVAEKHYRQAVELKPEGGAVNNNLGRFLCRNGRAKDSQTYFETAINDPFYKTPAVAYGNAGVCAEMRGDASSAEGYYRKALELDRKNLPALFALAKLSLARGEKLRARAFVQRYEAIAPLDAELLDLAIHVEESLGAVAAAVEYQRKLETDYPDVAKARAEERKQDD